MTSPVIELSYKKPVRKPSLKSFHTRQLLDILNGARRCGGTYNPYGMGVYYNLDEIKTELETREHIPNKQEAKKIRQEKAKAKRNR